MSPRSLSPSILRSNFEMPWDLRSNHLSWADQSFWCIAFFIIEIPLMFHLFLDVRLSTVGTDFPRLPLGVVPSISRDFCGCSEPDSAAWAAKPSEERAISRDAPLTH